MDNQDKSSVLQWLIPTGIMMVVLVAMLLSFSAKSNKEAEATVSKTLISVDGRVRGSFSSRTAKGGQGRRDSR